MTIGAGVDSGTGMNSSTGETITLAVIGAGPWARSYHLPALKALENRVPLRIGGIWNRTREKAVAAAEEFGIDRVYGSLEEAMDDDSLGCFAVLVNPSIIPEIVQKLLVRELPMLCEKTPGHTFQEAGQLADAVNVPNVVAFNRRYMPINQRFKSIVDEMEEIYFVECHFYRFDRLYPDFVISTGVHGINCMEYLFGPIESVQTEKWKNPSNDSLIWISHLRFDSGLRGILKFLPSSGSSVERYEAHCSTTSAYLYSPQTYTSDYPGRIYIHREGTDAETIVSREEDGMIINSGFVNEYLDLFEAMRHSKETASNFRNACNTMRVAEAIESGVDFKASP